MSGFSFKSSPGFSFVNGLVRFSSTQSNRGNSVNCWSTQSNTVNSSARDSV
ncbi:hypothetical protein HanXRQr2_Chr04g0173291 [Helianthus annuus]|uniref:Uncharacterized protein n=1 Tax=Helianthus annuus TaxID=4232 RepID=A0A9K3J9E1_HELAN|nr:hypothetical protein HanXRQr2_Chr04g0173291 [Helianthus annuus]KAJ0931875.1 hypothetical protein HanPSC8_Chr04g0167011 [Helianthus annuus]